MSSQSIKAGEAWWEITARDKATAIMDSIAARLKAIGKGTMLAGAAMTGVGSAVVGPILAAGAAFSNYVDGLNDASVKTGLTVSALSSLQFVAEQQGTSIEGLQTGLKGMAKFTTQVASGSKGAVKTLDALGISARDFMAATPEQRFRMLAEQISKIQDPTLRAGLAMKVFGKAGEDLLPMIALGSQGIADMQKRAEELGLTVSQADADKLGAFGDELAAIGRQVKMAWWQAGAALVEAFGWVVPIVQKALAVVIDFTRSHRPLVGVLVGAAAAVIAFGLAVTFVGGLIVAAGAVMSAVATMVSIAWTVAAGAVALLSGPIGLVVLAIAAVVAIATAAAVAFVQLTETGAACWSSIKAGFSEMLSVVGQVFRGIWDALMAGEWGLAASIGFAAVSLAWSVMVAGMSDAWYGFVNIMGSLLLGQLQLVDGAIRTVLNGLIGAYNVVAEKMGWATVSTLAGGSEMLAKWQADLDRWTDGKSKAAWGDVAKQRAALDKATADAAAKRKAREDAMGVKVPGLPDMGQPDLSKLAGGGKGGKAALGTFNATVAGMLNASVPDHLEKIADNGEKTNELLEEIRDKADEGGLAWE